ncbi:MAG TPA: ABC transporter permease [Clostridiaceae bacterium]|nr:ABC transporter permease [Clostridiaceae bacterium]
MNDKSAARTSQRKNSVGKIVGRYSFITIFLIIFAVFLIINHGATTWSGVMNILRHSTVLGILALGMGIVIVTGGIDLSIGSMLALIGGLSVTLFNATNSPLLTFVAAIGIGLILGLINGLFVGFGGMPAFIVTLSTMLIYRSIAQYYLRSMGLSIYNMNGNLSSYDSFYDFGQLKIATVPVVGIVLVIVTIIMVYLMTMTKFGKSVYAIGSNVKAAHLAGINVPKTRVLVFAISGVLCAIGAFLWLSMNGSLDPATIGKSYEMYAIAAVVIGGISMSGGKGKLLGVLFGAMSYTIIDKIIASLGFDALINDTIKGSILLVAVLAQIVVPAIRQK